MSRSLKGSQLDRLKAEVVVLLDPLRIDLLHKAEEVVTAIQTCIDKTPDMRKAMDAVNSLQQIVHIPNKDDRRQIWKVLKDHPSEDMIL
jgi:hypothetical protein